MVTVGDKFTEHFKVTPELHAGFIALFGDRHPLHTDMDYAKARGFSSVVMHGNILNGFLSYFVGERFPEREVMILSQQIKFARPVYMNDQLTLEVEIADIHQSVDVVEISCKFRNDAGKTVATAKMSIGRANAGGG